MSDNTPTFEFEEIEVPAVHRFVFKQREYEMPLEQYEAALQMFSAGNPAMTQFAQGIVYQAWANANAPAAIKKAKQKELADLAWRASNDEGVKMALAKYFAAVNTLKWRDAAPKFNDVSVFYSWDAKNAPTLGDVIIRTGGDGTITLTKDAETGKVRVGVRLDMDKSAALRKVRDESHANIAEAVRGVVEIPDGVTVGIADDFSAITFTELAARKSSGSKSTSTSGELPAFVKVTRLSDKKLYAGSPADVYEAMKKDGHSQAGFCPAYVVKRLPASKYSVEIGGATAA